MNHVIRTRGLGLILVFALPLACAAAPLEPWAARYVAARTLQDVAYGAGVFVAAADACYSSDTGVCWTARHLDSAPAGGMTGIAYGNGQFVTIGNGFSYHSPDGLSWQRGPNLPAGIRRLSFSGGLFLALGSEPNAPPDTGTHWLLLTSADGVAWTRQSGPVKNGVTENLNAAAFGNGLYLLAGDSGLMLSSTNLTDWQLVPGFDPAISHKSLAVGNGIFVAVGSYFLAPAQTQQIIFSSLDGFQWTSRLSGISGGVNAVTFGDGQFVAVGRPHLILSSADGVSWQVHSANVDEFLGVVYGNGSFVSGGGYYTDVPRGVAVQSGGRPQMCLQAVGFSLSGFQLTMTLETGHAYRLQASPSLAPTSWTDLRTFVLDPISYGPAVLPFTDSTASRDGQRFYQVVSP